MNREFFIHCYFVFGGQVNFLQPFVSGKKGGSDVKAEEGKERH